MQIMNEEKPNFESNMIDDFLQSRLLVRKYITGSFLEKVYILFEKRLCLIFIRMFFFCYCRTQRMTNYQKMSCLLSIDVL